MRFIGLNRLVSKALTEVLRAVRVLPYRPQDRFAPQSKCTKFDPE